MKLVIFNVKYSPNLGDGLLSECLERELRLTVQQPSVVSLDLAGRDDYRSGSQRRSYALALLQRLPTTLRATAASTVLNRLVRGKLEPAWRAKLAGADGVIVGGGNLFADVDLNFPMKISGALAAAASHRLPVAVHSVGATPNWSSRGAGLFAGSLGGSRLVDATVRDMRSKMVWRDALETTGIPAASIAPDPGLLTSLHFPGSQSGDAVPHVALGITAPVALSYHAAHDVASPALAPWLKALVAGLAARGFRVSLFTNGSPEDRAYLKKLAPELIGTGPADMVRVEPAFADPEGLAKFISSCDLVLGHRMHAAIAAHSYGVPAIGFAWDVKMVSFFELIGHAERLIDPAQVSPAEAVRRAEIAYREGVDPDRLERLICASRKSVARLAALFDVLH